MLTSEQLLHRILELAHDGKAQDVVAIDVRGRSSYADFLVIASGTSDRHVESVAERVIQTLRTDSGVRAIGTEGLRDGQWALADFGDVVLHVFHPFTRQVYGLEELWSQAPRVAMAAKAVGS